MISFRVGDYRFHYRAAAIIRDGDYVLLHRLDGDDFWALPGGRVNPGEQAKDTIVREFREELGAEVEKWPRLSEQLSPIVKWTAGGLQTVQSCPRRRSALATNRPTRWATRGAPGTSSYAAIASVGRWAK
jgi:8-oxo-dGTP pyrophosphatase MutT (NUDIX family)